MAGFGRLMAYTPRCLLVPWLFKHVYTLLDNIMQFKQIALAAAALVAASASTTSFAATAYLTGASASQPDFVLALETMCTSTAGNVFKKFKAPATNATKLENSMAFTCSNGTTGAPAQFSASGVDTVHQNVSGGSLTALTLTTATSAVSFIDPTSATCALISGSTNMYGGCSTLATGVPSEGGFTDTELTVPTAAGYLGSLGFTTIPASNSSGLLQTFGLAVSDDLYVLLYKAQIGKAVNSTLCPASTATNADIVAAGYGGTVGSTTYVANTLCQPTVSRAEMASIMAGTATAKNGGTLVFNGVTQKGRLVYCRRPITSGTQHSAQTYFLQDLGAIGGDYVMSASNAKNEVAFSGTFFVSLAGSGTGNVRDCLGGRNQDNPTGTDGNISATNNFRIGVISGENVAPVGYLAPTTSTLGAYKFVRLSEVALTEGTSIAKNKQTAAEGRYDFVYETRVMTPNASGSTTQFLADVVTAISGNFAGLYKINNSTATTAGTAVTTTFNHSGNNSTKPVLR
jgi:hypothetical protein